MSDETAKDDPRDLSKAAASDAAKDAPKDVSRDAPKDASGGAPERPVRAKSRRVPPTLDLKAEAVADEAASPAAPDEAATGRAQPGMEEAAADAGSTAPPFAGTPPADDAGRRAGAAARPPRGTATLALAAGLGGLAGAVATIFLQPLFAPTDTTAARLAVIERSVASLPKGGQIEAVDKRLATLLAETKATSERLAAAERKVEEARTLAGQAGAAPAADEAEQVSALAARVEDIEARVGRPDQALAESVAANADKLAALVSRLAAVEKAMAAQREGGPAVAAARAVVAAQIVQAVVRGEPYETMLRALTNLGGDPARLAPLQAAAGTGVAPLPALAQDFAPLAAPLAAEPPAAGDGSVVERLTASAARAFRVRPVGEATGQGPAAAVARIEAALARGDAAQALAAWKSLPEPARRASQAWGQRLEAHVAAQEAAHAALTDAMQTLGQGAR